MPNNTGVGSKADKEFEKTYIGPMWYKSDINIIGKYQIESMAHLNAQKLGMQTTNLHASPFSARKSIEYHRIFRIYTININ